MARYGTNAADSLQAFSDGGEIFGWDAGNAVGDEGPADDNDTILGLSGHDLISGGNGDDLLNWGGSGDRFFGGSGDDTLIGLRAGTGEQVALYGGTGDDQFLLYLDTAPNPQGVIVVDGGDGIDLLSFGNICLTTGVSLNIADLQGQYTRFPGMAITGIERVDFLGTRFADTVIGGTYADRVRAYFGDDVLRLGGGDDWLEGNAGNDYLTGGAGNDLLFGGANRDTLFGGDGDDVITDRQGSNQFSGGAGNDTLDASSASGDNLAARNFMYGGVGRDLITGGAGRDVLDGGAGADSLTGGTGADVFAFSVTPVSGEADRISDFAGDEGDVIRLSAAAFAGLTEGALAADAFVLGTVAGDAGDRILYDQATGSLWYDADGSGAGAAVRFALVTADLALTSADFAVL